MIPIIVNFKYKLNSILETIVFNTTGLVIVSNNLSITFIIWNDETKESLFFNAIGIEHFKIFSINAVLKLFKLLKNNNCYFYHSFTSYINFDDIIEKRKKRGCKILQAIIL